MTGADSIETSLDTLATIHATVELERALAEHGRPATDRAAAVDDPFLGAAVIVADVGGDRLLAIAEPTTEGRLAATLARHGEGTAGRYLVPAGGESLDGFRARATAAGVALSRVETGPFGPSVLLLVRPVTGPHLIVVERRTLPSPP